jgi:hypothetical protein
MMTAMNWYFQSYNPSPKREGEVFEGKPRSLGFQMRKLRHDFGPDGGLGFAYFPMGWC